MSKFKECSLIYRGRPNIYIVYDKMETREVKSRDVFIEKFFQYATVQH